MNFDPETYVFNVFLNGNITPVGHEEISVGLDGIGIVIGVEHEKVSYDFHIKLGWAPLIFVFAPQYLQNPELARA